jgi:AraC-like DNA-binding protein
MLMTRLVKRRPTDFMPEGPLTFRPQFARWETKSSGSPMVCVLARFEAMLLQPQDTERDARCLDDLTMIEMMRALHDEIRTPGFASMAMVESIGEVLRIKLSRLSVEERDGTDEAVALRKTDISLIHEYIEAQNGRSPSVTELAQLFNISRRSLLRRFKAGTGTTVAAYITQVQLTKAKRLLATSHKIIKQIAYETGFRNPSNFTVAFERAVGLTPTAFRKISPRPTRFSEP